MLFRSSCDDLAKILVEPENSLIRQYQALLGVEDVTLEFDGEAIREIATLAERMNAEMENIGARRLHTMIEYLLDEISFTAPERKGERIVIGEAEVRSRLTPLISDSDVRRYLL